MSRFGTKIFAKCNSPRIPFTGVSTLVRICMFWNIFAIQQKHSQLHLPESPSYLNVTNLQTHSRGIFFFGTIFSILLHERVLARILFLVLYLDSCLRLFDKDFKFLQHPFLYVRCIRLKKESREIWNTKILKLLLHGIMCTSGISDAFH